MNAFVGPADSARLMVRFRELGQNGAFQVTFVAVMAASKIATLGPITPGLATFEAGVTGMPGRMSVPLDGAL